MRNLTPHLFDLRVSFGRQLPAPTLTEAEANYLLHPAGTGKTGHERLFAESLAFSFEHDGRTFHYRWRTVAMADNVAAADVRAYEQEIWDGEIFQVKPDRWGTDLLAFFHVRPAATTARVRPTIHIYRWQTKTGNEACVLGPNSGTHRADKIRERFAVLMDDAKAYIVGGREHVPEYDFEVHDYIVTTCKVRTPAVAGIGIIDRFDMATKWTDRISTFLNSERGEPVRFMLSTA
jgi:hypothetical protein